MEEIKLTEEEKKLLVKANLQKITNLVELEEKLADYLQENCIENGKITKDGTIIENILDKIN